MNTHFSEISQGWQNKLSDSGCRMTRPRRVILDIIAKSGRPLTPLEVHQQAQAGSPSIGLVTVYRTIDKLEELGLVERVHHTNQCQTVFRGSSGHKHLLTCAACGQSVYFDGLEMENEFQSIAEASGYQMTGHWLQLSGLCPNCRTQKIHQKKKVVK